MKKSDLIRDLKVILVNKEKWLTMTMDDKVVGTIHIDINEPIGVYLKKHFEIRHCKAVANEVMQLWFTFKEGYCYYEFNGWKVGEL